MQVIDVPRLRPNLRALPTLTMRRAHLAELFSVVSVEIGLLVYRELVSESLRGERDHETLLALNAMFENRSISDEKIYQLYQASCQSENVLLSLLLLPAQPWPPELSLAETPRPDLSLGERTWLARRGQLPRHILEKLLADPEPRVVQSLLCNPRMTEAQVVRIASRRPTRPDTQQAIFRSERFIERHQIKRALVLNPHTPSDLASRLSLHLSVVDWREIAGDRALAPNLRQTAAVLQNSGF